VDAVQHGGHVLERVEDGFAVEVAGVDDQVGLADRRERPAPQPVVGTGVGVGDDDEHTTSMRGRYRKMSDCRRPTV
jgi:hypothetical protein